MDTTDGYRPIEEIRETDLVRTHTGRYMPVIQLMRRHADTDALIVKIMGAPEFTTTTEHPFWVRRKTSVHNPVTKGPRRIWSAPEWVPAGELDKSCFVGFQLDTRDKTVPAIGTDLAYIIGRWLGDGWIRDSKRVSQIPQGQRGSRVNSQWWQVFVCCARDEADHLEERLNRLGLTVARFEERTVTKFRINSKAFVESLQEFGRYAHGKTIPGWVYRLPIEDQAALWEGWSDADGSVQKTGQVRVTTVSERLAHGMARIARNVHQRAVSVHKFDVPPTTVIEGRTVNQRPQYQVVLPVSNREAFVEDGWVWVPVRTVTAAGPVEVFNIGVAEDESYTAWGIAVHNCQDLSTSGTRGGMTEGTRSNLWVSQREAIALLRPKFVVWENVRGAYSAKASCTSDPDGQTGVLRALGRVMGDMHALGYDAEWRAIQAYDVGAPHPRPRVFMLAWDRDQVKKSSDQEKLQAVWDPGADIWRKYDPTALGGYGEPHMDRLPSSGSLRSGTFAPRTVWNKPKRPKELVFPTPMVFDNQWIFHSPTNDNPGFSATVVHTFSPTPALVKPRIQEMQKIRQEKHGWAVELRGHVAGWGPYRPAILRWEQVTGNTAPKPTVRFHKDGRHNVNPYFMEWCMGLDPGWISDLWVPGITPKEAGPEQLTAQDVWKMCGNGVVPQQAEAALRDMHAHTDHA